MKKFLQRIEEEMKTNSPVVMAFGRMNPPTTGHEKLVNRVKEIAKDYNAPHHVIISHSSDAKKNPLDVHLKAKHAERFFPNTNIVKASKEEPTFLQHAARLNRSGHDHLVMVAGSDRVHEYEEKLNRYNGTHEGALFNFKRIEVKSAGERDPDAEGTEGMSASKMREHAKKNEFHSFRQGIPSHVNDRHARELYNDVRKGMGINEDFTYGRFKAIFVSGGPGSGKDIIIREAIANQNLVEINASLASSILKDKHSLTEQSRDFRREAIRKRNCLIINGTTGEYNNILYVKEELEELGYETMMIFVNTSNEASKERNEKHEKVLPEETRFERWNLTQKISENFNGSFSKYLEFDNSIDLLKATDEELQQKEEDITILYEMTNWFFDTPIQNKNALNWMQRNRKPDINRVFEQFIQNIDSKGKQKYVSEAKADSKTVTGTCTCGSKGKTRLFDNICPSCQLVRKQGKIDSVTDGDVASNSGYTWRTYEQSEPELQYRKEPKETKFQQDNEKEKARKLKLRAYDSGKVLKPAGVSPEYDTRGSGTVYPMSGLSQVTYREQAEHKYNIKKFSNFSKESIDSPSVEMGVTGGYHGPSNKEPLETQLDRVNSLPSNKKKKK